MQLERRCAATMAAFVAVGGAVAAGRAACLAAVVALAVASAGPGVARAAEPVATGPSSDPLPTTSLVAVGAGALALGTGATLLATAPVERECGVLGGCLPPTSEGTQHDAGAILAGGGAGLVAVGALGWLLTDRLPLLDVEARDAPALATGGLVATGIGAGALGAGLALGATGEDGFDGARAAPWLAVGGALLAAGVPLTLAGASREDAAERAAEEQHRRRARARAEARRSEVLARRQHDRVIEQRVDRGELERRTRNPALVASGAVVLGLGATATGACVIAAAADDSRGWGSMGRDLGYGAGAATGALVLITGAVMIGAGATTDVVEARPTAAARLAPVAVRIGAATASATWLF